jgi:hypothetical protein
MLTPETLSTYKLMSSRYWQLQEAVAGYAKTDVALVSARGDSLLPAGFGDDVGMYYFIPKLSSATHLPLEQTIPLFFITVVSAGFLCGCVGSFFLFKSWLARGFAVLALAVVTLATWLSGDVYVVSPSLVMAVLPWALYVFREPVLQKRLLIFLFVAGGVIGLAQHVRSHSGTAMLIFIASLLLLVLKGHVSQKIKLAVVLIVGYAIPIIWFQSLIAERDNYLTQTQSGYVKSVARHPFWHPFYVGFGFLNNPYGIIVLDQNAFERAKAISPTVVLCSDEYEQILKNEIITIVKKDPLFVMRTVFAKAGVIAFYILLFGNLGLIAAYLYPKPWQHELSFWLAIAFNALFGILLVPNFPYLVGMAAAVAFYNVVSLDFAIDRGLVSRIFPKLKPPTAA